MRKKSGNLSYAPRKIREITNIIYFAAKLMVFFNINLEKSSVT